MKAVKSIISLLFSAFLVFQTYDLVMKLWVTNPANLNFTKSLLIAFLLNLFITGAFAFPGFVLPTHKLLNPKYYSIRNRELLLKIYKTLHVNLFRKALLFAFWGREKNRIKYFNGTRKGLNNFIFQSKQSEFGHLAAFLISIALSGVLLIKSFFTLSLLCLVINIIGNFYPIILQRHHRFRIEKIAARFN